MRLDPDWTRLIATQLWQVTLLIPAAILLLRWLLPTRSHLAYGVLLIVLLKCVTPPVFTSNIGLLPWAQSQAEQLVPVISSDSIAVTGSPDARRPVDQPRVLPVEHSTDVTDDSQGPATPVVTADDHVESPALEQAASRQAEPSNSTPDTFAAAPPEASPVEARPVAVRPSIAVSARTDWAGRGAVLVWSVGLFLFCLWVLVSWRNVRRLCRTDPAPAAVSALAADLAAEFGLRRRPQVLVSRDAVMPFAMGIRRPVVLIPSAVIADDQRDDLEMVLAHELNHIRRGDTLVGAVQLLIQAVWWFHPLVWWLNREIRRYREHCCDEEVLARLECRPQRYARCLINVLELNERGTAKLGLAGMSPFEVTSQRLRNIMRSNAPFRRRMPLGAWLVLLAVALAVLPGARGVTANSSEVDVAEAAVESVPAITSGLKAAAKLATLPESGRAGSEPLRYEWEAGARYPYRVSIVVDHGSETETISGNPTWIVRNRYPGQAEFTLSGDQLVSTRITKPDRVPRFDPLDIPSIPRFPRTAFPTGGWRGPTFPSSRPVEHIVRIDDRGRMVAEQGEGESLPYFLGSLSALLFAPLPAAGEREWTESGGTEVSITRDDDANDPFPVPSYIFSSEPEPESLTADLTAAHSVTVENNAALHVHRRRTVSTVEQVDGRPRIELTEDAAWTLDAAGGMPQQLAADVSLVVRKNNVTTTYPIRITAERL